MNKLRQSAKGEACTFMIRGVCQGRRDTTVLCHGPYNYSRGKKGPDIFAAYGCYECHTAMDQHKVPPDEWAKYWLMGIRRTLQRFVEKELLEVK